MKTQKILKITSLWVLIFFTQLAYSQKDKQDTIVIKTSAICEMCKERIEKALAYEKGIEKSDLNLVTKNVKVIYKSQVINEEKIKLAISKAGYDACEVKADKKAYDKLPACCKFGSGHHH